MYNKNILKSINLIIKVKKNEKISITEFFDMQLAESIVQTHGKADAILSANVMCHIPYMHSIYDGVKFLLKEDGVFIFENLFMFNTNFSSGSLLS